jgi:hypothetical protein
MKSMISIIVAVCLSFFLLGCSSDDTLAEMSNNANQYALERMGLDEKEATELLRGHSNREPSRWVKSLGEIGGPIIDGMILEIATLPPESFSRITDMSESQAELEFGYTNFFIESLNEQCGFPQDLKEKILSPSSFAGDSYRHGDWMVCWFLGHGNIIWVNYGSQKAIEDYMNYHNGRF